MSLRRVVIGLALLLAAFGALRLERLTRPAAMPSFDAVRAAYRSSDAVLLDRNGAVIDTQRENYQVRRLAWTPLDAVSPAVRGAIVAAEDRRFWRHGGVDLMAVFGALRDRMSGRAQRGASTLDMQLAARLDPRLDAGTGRRSLLQKLRQVRAAWRLDARWTKAQIFEAYLNEVSFRGEWQGIAAASAALFGKAPSALTDAEAWTLAALLPAPEADAAAVAVRACALRGLAGAACDAQRRATRAALDSPSRIDVSDDDLAPQLARRLLHAPGERVRSTLDAPIQRLATNALSAQLQLLQRDQVRDGAAVVVDNASGEVLAYVGSAGPASRSPQVDGARAPRQAGSTLKPFLYSLAIEQRWLTAASLLDDAPVALEAGPGLYLPQNYDHDFKGLVSVRTALAGSLNVPAVRTLVLAGVEPFRERLHALGYVAGLTQAGEYYGYSLALGSAEVTLLEQVNAYRTLANGGRWSPLRYRLDDQQTADAARQIVSPQAAWIVADILSDRGARTVTFDLEGPLSTPYWAAVKTGTSKDLRDNWCIGFTPRYTVGVWVGNFEGDPMRTVSGITGAAPAWRDIMDGLQRGAPLPEPTPPAGLVRREVRFKSGREAQRPEWFIAGTEMTTVAAAPPTPERARLASPADGTLIALDPDIPLDRQHVTLRAEPADSGLRLQIDGLDVGTAKQPRLWTPVPGVHHLALLDARGKLLDQLQFSVRGLP